MPGIQLLGWLRQGPPPRPKHERGKGGSRRHKASAPPAGSGSGSGQHPGDQPSSGALAGSAEGVQQHGAGKIVASLPGTLGIAAVLQSARHWGFLWKALAVHSANLAATLAARPLQPLHDRLQRQLGATAAVQHACAQLQVDGLSELQDLLNCVILSEHVYKIVDHDIDTSVGMINAIKAEFPPQLVTLKSVLWAQPHVKHRFLLGESADALYVSFMGTKLPRDMATNANLFQEEVVLDAAMLSSGAAAADDIGGSGGSQGNGQAPAAHRGFLARARSVPIHSLYQEARARGKRLVLCGHSLGGAVASLCAIQLLQHLPENMHHTVSCYGFATPALGNEALAARVKECGWDERIRNYLSPDDPIPKLLSFRRPSNSSTADATKKPATQLAAAAAARNDVSGTSAQAGPNAAPAVTEQEAAAPGVEQMRETVPIAVAGHAPLVAAGQGLAQADVASNTALQAQQANNAVVVPGVVAAITAAKGQSGPKRSSTTPALVPAAAAAAEKAASAPQTAEGSDNHRGRFARAGVAAATSAAVAAAVLGQDANVAAAASAAVAAAMLQRENSTTELQETVSQSQLGIDGSAAGGDRRSRQPWLGQRFAAAAAPPLRAAAQRAGSVALAAAAPPMRVVAERAGSAARLVAMPLSAAASVPMRAAPTYLPLGRQLYITPASVTASTPAIDSFDAPAAGAAVATAVLPAPGLQRGWPFRRPAHQTRGEDSGSGSYDVEDNVDVAAAAALSDASAVAVSSAEQTDGAATSDKGKSRKRGGLFEAHRMATYRRRLLAICQGSLQGQLLLRSLPMLPSLPRPGDVACSELIAPGLFPLRATATCVQPNALQDASAASGASTVVADVAEEQKEQKLQQQRTKHPAAPLPLPGSPGSERHGFWQGLLARAMRQQRQEPPVELLIRVEGRGLATVTHAWVEGIQPEPVHDSSNAEGEKQSSSSSTAAKQPRLPTAEVTIVQQPRSPVLPPQQRPTFPLVAQISAFASWLAVTLGWVALLRQLQPAGSQDYLLARVRLPAAAVRSAQQAAQSSLLNSVGDGPLLPGLGLGPRLSLRLQSDFAVHCLPLDIRIASHSQRRPRPWVWPLPWQQHLRERPALTKGQAQQRQAHAQRRRRNVHEQLRHWWDWPSGDSPAASH